jgi:hypothetical protein
VRGVRRFLEAAAAEPRVSTTAIQTVGGKGYDGLAVAVAGSRFVRHGHSHIGIRVRGGESACRMPGGPRQWPQTGGPSHEHTLAGPGVVAGYPASSFVKLAEAGFPVTPGEAGAIEAAADASSEGYSAGFRTGMAQAVGLEQ